MSSTLSLTYLPGTSRSEALSSFSFPGIFRRVKVISQTHAFKVALESIAVLSIFVSLTIWVFAVSPSLSSL